MVEHIHEQTQVPGPQTHNQLFIQRPWIIVGIAILASILSMIYLDHRLVVFFNNDHEPYMTIRKAARELTDLAYGTKYFILALAMIILPLIMKKFFHKDTSRLKSIFHWGAKLLLSLISAGIVIQTLKGIIGRARPHKTPDFDAWKFQHLTTDFHFHSMPSGHSQTVFVLVGILTMWAFQKGQPKWCSLYFGIGCLLAFTRVMTHQHFLSDCIIGSMIGFLMTYATCRYYDRKYLAGSVRAV